MSSPIGGPDAASAADLMAQIEAEPRQPRSVYVALAQELYRSGRFEDGERFMSTAVEQHPEDMELWNIRGVMLRRLKRYPEAVAMLRRALELSPDNPAVLNNLGNALLDMGDAPAAEQVFAQLASLSPASPEVARQLGRSRLAQGKVDAAFSELRRAVSLRPTLLDAWIDMASYLGRNARTEEAEAVADEALAANPNERRLIETKVTAMRLGGRLRACETYLTQLLQASPEAGWLHFQLGSTVVEGARDRGLLHLREALRLEPTRTDVRVGMIEALERKRGEGEGEALEESYQLSRTILQDIPSLTPAQLKILNELFGRICAFDDLPRLGSFKDLGRAFADYGRHTAFLTMLGRVESDADRLELVEQHRRWARPVERRAAERPIRRPAPRPVGEKIRLGVMSSDLRQHPVGYFALPLFDHLDRDRFEVFVYSYFRGADDGVLTHIRDRASAYRWWSDISARDAAQKIAEDDLDMLIELGGSTHMNKLEVMAFRPAPRQASWLGYPHSAGLSTLDYFICDPHSQPSDPRLLIETPLVMPRTWLALGRAIFSEAQAKPAGIPEERNGFITFGTANNPLKYSRAVLGAWAKVAAKVPNSRFAFIRPEGGSETFRSNIAAEFAAHGVGADRLVWWVTRGRHMPIYNEVDISLDTFPLTGGTTTTEALWMGVPVVSLVGEAFHERLGYSLLSNAGLGDLCAADLEAYEAIALGLAADTERRRTLRHTLRDRILQGPLGQTEQFARDFYDLIWKTVRQA